MMISVPLQGAGLYPHSHIKEDFENGYSSRASKQADGIAFSYPPIALARGQNAMAGTEI